MGAPLTGILPRVVLAEALARLAYLGRLRDCAVAITQAGPPESRLRASELAAAVAIHPLIDVQNSPWFRRDLSAALHVVGWRSVAVGNVRMWKGRLMR